MAKKKLVRVGQTSLLSEEDVKVKHLVPFLESKGYKQDCIEFDKAIEVQEGRKRKTIFADAVVYTNAKRQTPLLVCETKPPNEVLNKAAREQVISYARLLTKIAPLVILTNGLSTQVYHSVSKAHISDLPERKELTNDFLKFVISKDVQDSLREEAKHELFVIDDVQTFKTVLEACHNEIRNNEGYDPAKAFDEMSKVLFCKMFEEKRGLQTNRFRVSVFDEALSSLKVNLVKQIFAETKQDSRFADLFDPGSEIALHDRTIRKIVSIFESYDLSLTAFDVKGEAFEYFLGETFTGGLGEYFTPRNVVEFMVDAIDPKIGSKIVDPFCGTGGFLIYAFDTIGEKIRLNDFSDDQKQEWRIQLSNKSLYGTDWKERTSLACKMNMIVHGDGSAGIFMHHGLIDVPGFIEENIFDICLTNPPFGSTESDPCVLQRYELGNGRNSQDRLILGIERSLNLVKAGGTVCIVVIDGVLNNDSMHYVRNFISEKSEILAVISLPAVTFEGYHARAKTSILIVKKRHQRGADQKPVFMAVVENTGYAPNGSQIAGNELPEVLLAYKSFQKGEKSFSKANCWLQIPSGRLDAEFYFNRKVPETITASATDARLIEALASTHEATASMEKIRKHLPVLSNHLGFTTRRLSDLIEEVSEQQPVEDESHYPLLGVKWWGGGTFLREEKLGREISATKLNKVQHGLLIYNRLFAFRGSFAIVSEPHNGCFVSSEFPTFAVKAGIENPVEVLEYIITLFNSEPYLAIVDRESTGSTKNSRNRYKSSRFLATQIPFPGTAEQLKSIVEISRASSKLRAQQAEILDQVKQAHAGMMTLLPKPI